MSKEISPPSLLRRFFDGLVQHAFVERLGIPDPRLADYVAELLCRFFRFDAIFGIRDVRGRRLEDVAEMLIEANAAPTGRDRQRAIHKHIGDFVLFWSGIYPECLRLLRAPSRKDHLIDYMEEGRRSYYIASTFDDEPFRKEAPTLRKLSAELELCAFGLSLVRQEWESLQPDSYQHFHKHW